MTRIFLLLARDLFYGAVLTVPIFLHAHWSVGLLGVIVYLRFALDDLLDRLHKHELALKVGAH